MAMRERSENGGEWQDGGELLMRAGGNQDDSAGSDNDKRSLSPSFP